MKQHQAKYKAIAKKYGYTARMVQQICDSQFKFMSREMQKDGRETLYLQGLGRWRFNESLYNLLMERKRLKDERNEAEQKEQLNNI